MGCNYLSLPLHLLLVQHSSIYCATARAGGFIMHDDVIKWKHFPHYWPFVRGINRAPVNSPHKRPVTRSFDVFFDVCLNKRLGKQSWGWWFEMPSHPLWRQSNGIAVLLQRRVLCVNQWIGCVAVKSYVGPACIGSLVHIPLPWRHNGRDGVSNHRHLDCLLNRLIRRRSKETSKLRVTGLCEGNSSLTSGLPPQRANNAENVSFWWRHHAKLLQLSWRFVTRLNTKTVFPGIENSVTKIKRSWDRLIFIMMGIPIYTVKTAFLYWDGPK